MPIRRSSSLFQSSLLALLVKGFFLLALRPVFSSSQSHDDREDGFHGSFRSSSAHERGERGPRSVADEERGHHDDRHHAAHPHHLASTEVVDRERVGGTAGTGEHHQDLSRRDQQSSGRGEQDRSFSGDRRGEQGRGGPHQPQHLRPAGPTSAGPPRGVDVRSLEQLDAEIHSVLNRMDKQGERRHGGFHDRRSPRGGSTARETRGQQTPLNSRAWNAQHEERMPQKPRELPRVLQHQHAGIMPRRGGSMPVSSPGSSPERRGGSPRGAAASAML